MDIERKLSVLAAAAKYDVACTSSGSDRGGKKGQLGNTAGCGICHSFSGDGRCISLLKILLTNDCVFDCKYCVNRVSNDIERATFTPREVADLTINFYKRNYIEGLFLSSAVRKNPDHTMEEMYETIRIIRDEYKFNGYIHIKAIPGAEAATIYKTGLIVDRMSVNIELPSQDGLKMLAPQKSKDKIIKPMNYITRKIIESKEERKLFRNAPSFTPAGQSTQMIVGATNDSDKQIIHLSESLYKTFKLRRVFYSAFVPVVSDPNLPALTTKPPMLREHRLYQADWLIRFYGFKASELLDDDTLNFNTKYDPKCDWALRHMEMFPVEVNKADYFILLRVPGIGQTSAGRIVAARKYNTLDFDALKRLGVVLKRARFFITCKGKYIDDYKLTQERIEANLSMDRRNMPLLGDGSCIQNSLFEDSGSIFGGSISDKSTDWDIFKPQETGRWPQGNEQSFQKGELPLIKDDGMARALLQAHEIRGKEDPAPLPNMTDQMQSLTGEI